MPGSNNTLSWNSIRTQKFKYMFFPQEQKEMLFDMDIDPNEMNDLATTEISQLEYHRNLLIQQWVDEGRDEKWLKDGKL